MQKTHLVFTIVARNYLAQSIVLGKSLARTNPHIDYYILIADCTRQEAEALARDFPELEKVLRSYQLVFVDEIGLLKFRQMALRYEALEFCTSIKAAAFLYFAKNFKGRVISYFDPDIKIYSPLLELEERLMSSSVVIMPHINQPYQDHLNPSLIHIQQSGVYNFGYVGVNPSHPEAIQLLNWWNHQLEYGCTVSIPNSIFVDQKWGNYFPCFAEKTSVLRHDGYNVAYWNLHERRLSQTEQGLYSNEVPLRFFHFSGYKVNRPDSLSVHQNRIILKGSSLLSELVEDYREDLLISGFKKFKALPYAWDYQFSSLGQTKRIRSWYRHLWDQCAAYGLDPFSHPEIREKGGNPPSVPVRDEDEVTSAPASKWAQIRWFLDQQYVFLYPIYRSIRSWLGHNRRFLNHVMTRVRERQRLQNRKEAVSSNPVLSASPQVHVFGYLTAELGVGESCRGLIEALDQAEVSTGLFDIVDTPSRKQDLHLLNRLQSPSTEASSPLSIVHVNADQVQPFLSSQLGKIAMRSSKKIGYWYWELEEFPDQWSYLEMYFDEIWVATTFVQKSLQAKLKIPVVLIPPAIRFTKPSGSGKDQFGIAPNTRVVLTLFDGFSYVDRKNPKAVIETFKRIKQNPQFKDVTLVVKAINLTPSQEAELKEAASGHPIHVVNRYLNRQETMDLVAASDCLISLHRSEGLGLTLLEAMGVGVPVVATGYSGNMDFMNAKNSFPVRYSLKTVGVDQGPYRASCIWADADVSHAAEQLTEALSGSSRSRQIAQEGQRTVLEAFGAQRVSGMIRSRMEHLMNSKQEPRSFDALSRRSSAILKESDQAFV